MQRFNFIEKLAENVSNRLGRKVETYDIESFLFCVALVLFAIVAVVFFCWYFSDFEEKSSEIATAFVNHFTTLK